MKHNATQSVKFTRLVRWLRGNLPECPVSAELVAVGILERLWHFVIANAPRGDVGRFSDDEIAEGVGWYGDAAALVAALSESGWLDRCYVHRIVVHDWRQHAPNHVKGNAARHGGFVVAQLVKQAFDNQPNQVEEPPQGSLLNGASSREPPQGSLPPNQTKPNVTQPNLTRPNQTHTYDSQSKSDHAPDRSPSARSVRSVQAFGKGLNSPEFTEFYAAYPRRVAPKNAAKAYAGAVKELISRGRSPPEAHAYLLAAAREFAAAAVCKCEPRFIPHPATWLNSARYDDDRGEWNRRQSNGRQLGFSDGPGQVYAGPDSLGEV